MALKCVKIGALVVDLRSVVLIVMLTRNSLHLYQSSTLVVQRDSGDQIPTQIQLLHLSTRLVQLQHLPKRFSRSNCNTLPRCSAARQVRVSSRLRLSMRWRNSTKNGGS